MALNNPLPTTSGCSESCHESHFEILEKKSYGRRIRQNTAPHGPQLRAQLSVG